MRVWGGGGDTLLDFQKRSIRIPKLLRMNIACPWENELKLLQYSENKQLVPDLKEPHASCKTFTVQLTIHEVNHSTTNAYNRNIQVTTVDFHLQMTTQIVKGWSNSNEMPDKYDQSYTS